MATKLIMTSAWLWALAATVPLYGEPTVPPPENRMLDVRTGPGSHVLLSDGDEAPVISFRPSTIKLWYGLRKPSSAPGKILVKVERVYRDGNASNWDYAQRTNARIDELSLYHESNRSQYDQHHRGTRSELGWRNFHEIAGTSVQLRKFIFPSTLPTRPMTQGVRLYSYTGVRPEGSWVPFEVETRELENSPFVEMIVSVVDLTESNLDSYPTWTLKRAE
jgi:hypothetical protein